MPLSVVSAKSALNKILNGKATVEDESPFFFSGAEEAGFRIPYVIRMTYEVKPNRNTAPPRFSRRGVLVRDNFTCAYCGKYGDTIDHVVPSSKGGASSYENCVTACHSCNNKKGDKTLAQMGWTLEKRARPNSKYAKMLSKALHDPEMHRTWIEYFAWYDEGAKAEKQRLYA